MDRLVSFALMNKINTACFDPQWWVNFDIATLCDGYLVPYSRFPVIQFNTPGFLPVYRG